jgi:hypothetical protein
MQKGIQQQGQHLCRKWQKLYLKKKNSKRYRLYPISELQSMAQISMKTPNPKCRLYWCLIELIDWRHSQSCWYFRTLLWTRAPLTFSMVHLPPSPPLPCVNNYRGTCIHTMCNKGGGWGDPGPRTDKHLPPSTFTGQLLRKADIEGLVSF